VPQHFEVIVSDEGVFSPRDRMVETKTVDVTLQLVTPDGEAAPGCICSLAPQFGNGTASLSQEVPMRTDEGGLATATVSLLEPYVFRVRDMRAPEYMPQEFAFLTDRRTVTAVVARSVFGPICERQVVFVVDTSGSMGPYLSDVKAALNMTIARQFHQSNKRFNVVAATGCPTEFRPGGLVDCTPANIEDAMRFCESMSAGGTSNILRAIAHVLRTLDFEAMYLVTDGKCDVGDEFLGQVKTHFLQHPGRPKIHPVGINCVPQRLTYRGLGALASMTHATFRRVCLQQDVSDPVGDLVAAQGGAAGGHAGLSLLDLAGAAAEGGTTTEEEAEDCRGGDDGLAE